MFSRGSYAQGQEPRGTVIDFHSAIEIGGVRIRPGDLLFGDREGVIVIPRDAEAEAIAEASPKASTENLVADVIRSGMAACDAFRQFGIT